MDIAQDQGYRDIGTMSHTALKVNPNSTRHPITAAELAIPFLEPSSSISALLIIPLYTDNIAKAPDTDQSAYPVLVAGHQKCPMKVDIAMTLNRYIALSQSV